MRIYKTKECKDCPYKGRCTRNPKGRIIYRWEHEEILEEMDIRFKKTDYVNEGIKDRLQAMCDRRIRGISFYKESFC